MRALLALGVLVACKQDAKAPPPAPAPAPTHTATPAELVRGANHLALQVMPTLPAGTVVVSPATVAATLAITWGGAKGETAGEIGHVLGLTGAADVVLGQWGNMITALGKRVTLATRLYGEKSADIDTTYFTIVRHAFDIWIEPVDFAAARDKINAWVAEQNPRVPAVLDASTLSAATKLAIISAPVLDTTVTATSVRTAANETARLTEVPLPDELALYVVSPLAGTEPTLGDALKTLEPKLAPGDAGPAHTLSVDTPLQLASSLQALGIRAAFDPQHADFSGMARDKLFLSSVVHHARVEIKGVPVAPPFQFVVVDRASGLFVFAGRVVN